MLGFAKKLFGSSNERKVKQLQGRVAAVNALEPEMAALSDDALKAKTPEFKGRIEKGETLDALLPEAFAVVREASKRVLGLRHFDVQLVGGMTLHKGGIGEMRTGEGKTLVATLPVYLNALAGLGVHLVTVNDYLATRDSEQMGRLYAWLGLSTGLIVNGLSQPERHAAYASDVTYGTNNEFGFDYLRDNLTYDVRDMVQRGHNFAIVDEVDSILIDEARTPLIISGPTEDRSDFYRTVDAQVKSLIQDVETYEYDEKQKQIHLTELGNERIEEMLGASGALAQDSAGLYDAANISVVHHVNQALRANIIYLRDRDYIVRAGEVMLIDEFTGRMMHGRRLSEGLHQAIEAKEHVEVMPENQTLASVTIQNYFRLYAKLSGMTGTAATEAQEFGEIYNMDVAEIPTNRPVIRIDEDDEVYRTAAEKNGSICATIADCYVRGQPILVGTVSIEKSEQLSELLNAYDYKVETSRTKKPEHAGADAKALEKLGDEAFDVTYETGHGVPHNVLNARFHEQEAYIVAEAGAPGSVTIATNMAGRGTDIQLGGNFEMRMQRWREELGFGAEPTEEEVRAKEVQTKADIAAGREKTLAAGGLYVLGTERHESRRIDNQLRGRTGRQGDPGHSKFYLSCEDDLLRIFAGERMDAIMRTFGLQPGEAITHPWLNRAISTAQRKVEERNYDVRKNLLKYDDVVNDQRKAVFEQRQAFMVSEDLSESVAEMRQDTVEDFVSLCLPPKTYAEQWDAEGLRERLMTYLGLDLPVVDWVAEEGVTPEDVHTRISEAADARAVEREAQIGAEQARGLEKNFMLQMIDMQWREHLTHLDHLRQVIGLRGYGQRDPLNEYKSEAYALFEKLTVELRQNVTRWMMTVEFQFQSPDSFGDMAGAPTPTPPRPDRMFETHLDPTTGENERDGAALGAEGGFMAPEVAERLPPSALPAGWEKTARNAMCPCGSGKKFKHCHGALA